MVAREGTAGGTSLHGAASIGQHQDSDRHRRHDPRARKRRLPTPGRQERTAVPRRRHCSVTKRRGLAGGATTSGIPVVGHTASPKVVDTPLCCPRRWRARGTSGSYECRTGTWPDESPHHRRGQPPPWRRPSRWCLERLHVAVTARRSGVNAVYPESRHPRREPPPLGRREVAGVGPDRRRPEPLDLPVGPREPRCQSQRCDGHAGLAGCP